MVSEGHDISYFYSRHICLLYYYSYSNACANFTADGYIFWCGHVLNLSRIIKNIVNNCQLPRKRKYERMMCVTAMLTCFMAFFSRNFQ